MRFFLGVFCLLTLCIVACDDDFHSTIPNKGNLEFSKDTIFLDTVFSYISSSTRTLKVYNKGNENITIPKIALGRGEQSFYRLNVDGLPGKVFEDIDLLAKDSMYIFIEATIDFNQVVNPIYTDSIVFDSGDKLQDVDLVTLVQDAHFLYPSKDANGVKETIKIGVDDNGESIEVEGFYLNGSQTWTKDKPYVVYGFAGVATNESLTIEKGTKIYFHQNSGLLIDKEASLRVNGSLEEKVVFEGDRLEFDFSETPGQWQTIWLKAGSKNNTINHAKIKNNHIGILVDSLGQANQPTLKITNTEIYNTSSFGLLGRQAAIVGNNLVIANNALSSLACTYGGDYQFTHFTLANFWNNNPRQISTLYLNNYIRVDESTLAVADLRRAEFNNGIISGGNQNELLLEPVEGATFNYFFNSNAIKFERSSTDPLYDFDDTNHYQNNLINAKPSFKDISKNEYQITQDSEVINKANTQIAADVPLDLGGIDRTQAPDMGAYQHIIVEEN